MPKQPTKGAAKRQPTEAQKRAAVENKICQKRSAALTLLQTSGRWTPFVGPTGKIFWHVPSERAVKAPTAGGKSEGTTPVYTVYVEPGAPGAVSCTCPNFMSTKLPCKHIVAVKTYQRLVKTHENKHKAAVAAAVQAGGSHRVHRDQPGPGGSGSRAARPAAAGR